VPSRKEQPLAEYQRKRDFEKTPEPAEGPESGGGNDLVFVIQKHRATRLHYDLRLEFHGAMVSWAVPRGPSYDPADKRMAVHVEDHPISYNTFEGVIPRGNYGAGEVIVWDRGTYTPDEDGETSWGKRSEADARMEKAYRKGKVSIFFRGEKLKGSWTLVRTGRLGGKEKNKDWLLIKHRDEYADANRDVTQEDQSVQCGLTIEDIKSGRLPPDPVGGAYRNSTREGSADEPAPGARRAPFPKPNLRPMMAKTASAPFNKPGWLFEPKLDGIRVLAYIHEGRAQFISRNGNDLTRQYPSLAADLPGRTSGEAVLDGEIVALDEDGRPSFQRLQQRMNLTREADIQRVEREVPVGLVLFDILHHRGWDLTRVPLDLRRGLLWKAVDQSPRIGLVETHDDGIALYEMVSPLGFEGVVGKRRDSIYEPGVRSASWLKIKAFKSAEFVIAGYTEGQGNRSNTIGSLVLGYHDDEGRLVWAGNAGSGFDDRGGAKDIGEMKRRLDAVSAPDMPFDLKPDFSRVSQPWTRGRGHTRIHWVEPNHVAEVKYAEWTEGGNLRAPVFLRLRPDVNAAHVRRIEDRLIVPVSRIPSGPSDSVGAGSEPAPASPPFVGAELSPARSGADQNSHPPFDDEVNEVLVQLNNKEEKLTLDVAGERVALTNLNKPLWPKTKTHRAYTKRDLVRYYARVFPYILPHLKDRPLTLVRYPNGIEAGFFYQKHMPKVPTYVETLNLWSSHSEGDQEYMMVNNLPTLVWLAQMADIEMHPWLARYNREPDAHHATLTATGGEAHIGKSVLNYPDFLLVDLDPYIYSGKEKRGDEPALNKKAFAKAVEVAFWARDLLEGIGLTPFLKTTGKTGLHLFVPIVRDYTYDEIREAAGTIGSYLMQGHREEITMEWKVEKRTGKIFWDHNMNVRGKNLASVYSARPNAHASVSIPVRWEELKDIYPTQFTIETVFDRLDEVGDLWSGVLDAKHDLRQLLGGRP
jgi:bifunctional non-homologous end joining protein LigD